MTRDEARRLELARKVWRESTPNDEAVERAVRRLSRRLSERGGRDPARRVLSFGMGLLVFGAALAYAASGGVKLPFGAAPPAPTAPGDRVPAALASSSPVAEPKAPASREPDGETESEPSDAPPAAEANVQPRGAVAARAPAERRSIVRSSAPAAAPSEPAPPPPPPAETSAQEPSETTDSEKRTPAKPASAGWGDVSRALAAKDDVGARRALESLGSSSDARTRAKAQLGLAQLAASRGDCVRARTLANQVATGNEADPRTAARARALARRCAR